MMENDTMTDISNMSDDQGQLVSETKKSWRDGIKVHPAADLFPMLPPDELQALGEDIKKNGLRVPVTFFKEQKHSLPQLLDGRNRLDAMEAVGLTISVNNIGTDLDPHIRLWMRGLPNDPMGWPIEVAEVLGDQGGGDPYGYVIGANVHRRHLTAEQKRDLIVQVLKAQPSKSNRQVAKTVGVSHPHVATVRAELEKSGDVETITTSIDTRGRKQPARKPAEKKRRDLDDYLAEKKARSAATKDADAPGLVPQQTDIEDCIAQCDEKSSAVQRILDAIEKLDDQQLAELKAALQQQWPSGLGVRVENVSGLMPDIPEFLRRQH